MNTGNVQRIEPVFDGIIKHITNALAITAFFVAATVLAHRPEMSFGFKPAVAVEVVILLIFGFVLLAINIWFVFMKIMHIEANKYVVGIGGAFLMLVLIHINGALALSSIKSVSGQFQSNQQLHVTAKSSASD